MIRTRSHLRPLVIILKRIPIDGKGGPRARREYISKDPNFEEESRHQRNAAGVDEKNRLNHDGAPVSGSLAVGL